MDTKRKSIVVFTIFVASFTVGLIDAIGETKVSRCRKCSNEKVLVTEGQPCSFEYNGKIYYGTFATTLRGRTCEWAFTLSNCTGYSARIDCIKENGFSGRPIVAYICVE